MSAFGLSGDGRTVVGCSPPYKSGDTEARKPCAWNAKTGIRQLELADFDEGAATAASKDGHAIVGWVSQGKGVEERNYIAYWNPKLTVVSTQSYCLPLASRFPSVSVDGKWVVGECQSKAFKWSIETGLQFLPPLDSAHTRSTAVSVSNDGSTVLGASSRGEIPKQLEKARRCPSVFDIRGTEAYEACVWKDGRVVGLGRTKGSDWSRPEGMTEDGEIVAGNLIYDVGLKPFVWTRLSGRTILADLPGHSTRADSIHRPGAFRSG